MNPSPGRKTPGQISVTGLADGRFGNQQDFLPAPGRLSGGAETGDAAADNQDIRFDILKMDHKIFRSSSPYLKILELPSSVPSFMGVGPPYLSQPFHPHRHFVFYTITIPYFLQFLNKKDRL